MEFVGEAVREYVLATGGSGKKVVVLGIASWGNVNNQQALIGKEVRMPFGNPWQNEMFINSMIVRVESL